MLQSGSRLTLSLVFASFAPTAPAKPGPRWKVDLHLAGSRRWHALPRTETSYNAYAVILTSAVQDMPCGAHLRDKVASMYTHVSAERQE